MISQAHERCAYPMPTGFRALAPQHFIGPRTQYPQVQTVEHQEKRNFPETQETYLPPAPHTPSLPFRHRPAIPSSSPPLGPPAAPPLPRITGEPVTLTPHPSFHLPTAHCPLPTLLCPRFGSAVPPQALVAPLIPLSPSPTQAPGCSPRTELPPTHQLLMNAFPEPTAHCPLLTAHYTLAPGCSPPGLPLSRPVPNVFTQVHHSRSSSLIYPPGVRRHGYRSQGESVKISFPTNDFIYKMKKISPAPPKTFGKICAFGGLGADGFLLTMARHRGPQERSKHSLRTLQDSRVMRYARWGAPGNDTLEPTTGRKFWSRPFQGTVRWRHPLGESSPAVYFRGRHTRDIHWRKFP